MICEDGKTCNTWFGADGSLFCRHGLVAEATQSTAVNWKCPLELQTKQELEKWQKFMENLPVIKKHFNSLRPTKNGDEN